MRAKDDRRRAKPATPNRAFQLVVFKGDGPRVELDELDDVERYGEMRGARR